MSTLSRADNGFLRVVVAFGAGVDKQAGDIDIAGLATATSTAYTPPDGYKLICIRYQATAALLQTGGVPAAGQFNIPSGAIVQLDLPGDNAVYTASNSTPIAGAIDVSIDTAPGTFTAGHIEFALVFERLP